jgi:hypothetical protein
MLTFSRKCSASPEEFWTGTFRASRSICAKMSAFAEKLQAIAGVGRREKAMPVRSGRCLQTGKTWQDLAINS